MTELPDQPIECFRCGICCTRHQPRIAEEEISAIACSLGISRETFIETYVLVTAIGYLLRQEDGECIFLEREPDGNRAYCSIYPHRPAPCREWAGDLSKRECREGLVMLSEAERAALLRSLSGSEAVETFAESLPEEPSSCTRE